MFWSPALRAETVLATSPDELHAVPRISASSVMEMQGNPRITLSVKDSSLAYVLPTLADRANLLLMGDVGRKILARRVTMQWTNADVMQAFQDALKGTGVAVRLSQDGRTVLLQTGRVVDTTTAGAGVVSGRVIDSVTGRALERVTVSVAGTKIAAVTDATGAFTLSRVPSGTYSLAVRFLGYESRIVMVNVGAERVTVPPIALFPAAASLAEVVTTATGTARRVEIGNDITVINVSEVQETAPVTSVTDILEARVPGLTVLRSSGQPGDPARIRLRGAGSVMGNNDPIIIVDGVRMYSDQTSKRSGNLAARPTTQLSGIDRTTYAAPSPLDQIDPAIIETIEVMKGPSAGALYGSDAANGVIVVTTKRGRAGPPRWNIAANRGIASLSRDYPQNTFIFGKTLSGGLSHICTLAQIMQYRSCATIDSTVSFQALNHPDYTVIDRGNTYGVNLSVSGGTPALLYALSGQSSEEQGILKLPNIIAQDYRNRLGVSAPDWMRRPDKYSSWSVQGRMTAQVSPTFQAGLTTVLNSSLQQRSSLGLTAIPKIQEMYISASDPTATLFGSFYDRVNAETFNTLVSGNINWQLREWLPITATAGINNMVRNDKLQENMPTVAGQPKAYAVGRGTSVVRSATVTSRIPMWQNRMHTSVGFNINNQTTSDVRAYTDSVPTGVIVPSTGLSTFSTSEATTMGWFVEPTFNLGSRFFIVPGFRLDFNGLAGANARLNGFPKTNLSWVMSDESFFPWKSTVDMLRLRTAFGYAGVQPGPTQRLRLMRSNQDLTNLAYPGILLSTVGNTELRPEKSYEWEGGFDLELLRGRLNVMLSQYVKVRNDAIIDAPLAPSLSISSSYGVTPIQSINIGVVRNTGTELTVSGQVIESAFAGWHLSLSTSFNNNKLVKLAPGVDSIQVDQTGTQRIVPGYPLYGRWGRPVQGYYDVNEDGLIGNDEVRLADSAVFLGRTDPRYTLGVNSSVSLFRGRVTVNSLFSYINGLTQFASYTTNTSATAGMNPYAMGSAEWLTNLGRQAAVLVKSGDDGVGACDGVTCNMRSNWGMVQRVNVLRWQSLSVNFALPQNLVRRLSANSISVALQGSNLGLWSNYMGKDPMVNGFSSDERVSDSGQQPTPRIWSLRISVGR